MQDWLRSLLESVIPVIPGMSQQMSREIAISNTSGGLKLETGMIHMSRSVRLSFTNPGVRALTYVVVTRTVTNHAGQRAQLVQRRRVC